MIVFAATCADSNVHCPYWASIGQCVNNPFSLRSEQEIVSSRLEELSPNIGLGKSDAIHVVVSPLISLMCFARMFPLD